MMPVGPGRHERNTWCDGILKDAAENAGVMATAEQQPGIAVRLRGQQPIEAEAFQFPHRRRDLSVKERHRLSLGDLGQTPPE